MSTIEIEEPQPARHVLAHSALRIATGAVVLVHVWPRVLHQIALQQRLAELGVPEPRLAAWLVLGGAIFAGVALILGLFTRVAAFGVLCGLVAWLALTLQQGAASFAAGMSTDRLELRLLLLGASLFFLALGAGTFSADNMLRRRARHRAIANDAIWQSPPYSVPPAHMR